MERKDFTPASEAELNKLMTEPFNEVTKSNENKQTVMNMSQNFSHLVYPDNLDDDVQFDTTAPREAGAGDSRASEFMPDEIQELVKAVIDKLGKVPTKEEMIIELTQLGLDPFTAVDIVNSQLIFDEDTKSSEAQGPDKFPDWTEEIKAKENCGCSKETAQIVKTLQEIA